MKNLKKYKVSLAVKIPANFEIEVSAKSKKEAFDKAYDNFDRYDEGFIVETSCGETELNIGDKNIYKLGNGIYIDEIS